MIILSIVINFCPSISPNDIFRINAMTLMRQSIDQYDVRRIINDLKSITKTMTSVLKVSTYNITTTASFPIGRSAILVLLSFWTFEIVVILCRLLITVFHMYFIVKWSHSIDDMKIQRIQAQWR